MKTILLVDDEFGIVDALTDLLKDEGYRIISAPNGQRGLEVLKKTPPDLVMLDVMMPVMNGPEMLWRMRAQPDTAAIPVVLMSAAPVPQDLLHDRVSKGYSEYLRKPFDLDRLTRTITAIIGPGEVDSSP